MTELIVKTIQGYRAFRLEGSELLSLSGRYVWEPGWNEAQCMREASAGSTKHLAPAPRCSCGFWVYRTIDRAMRQFGGELSVTVVASGYGDFDGPTGMVLGRVQIAGRVIAGTDGWRAERAGVVAVYSDDTELLASVADVYGVSIEPTLEMNLPVHGVLTNLSDNVLRVLLLDGDRKFSFDVFRVEKGSAAHLAAMSAAGGEVVVEYERRQGFRWVTSISEQQGECGVSG